MHINLFFFVYFLAAISFFWPLLCLCRPFFNFERCLDLNPESHAPISQCASLFSRNLSLSLIILYPPPSPPPQPLLPLPGPHHPFMKAFYWSKINRFGPLYGPPSLYLLPVPLMTMRDPPFNTLHLQL